MTLVFELLDFFPGIIFGRILNTFQSFYMSVTLNCLECAKIFTYTTFLSLITLK